MNDIFFNCSNRMNRIEKLDNHEMILNKKSMDI